MVRHLSLVAWSALVCGLTSVMAQEAATETPPPATAAPKADLSQTQLQLLRDFERFEKSLYDVAEFSRRTDPERAELLFRARGQSQEQRLLNEMQILSEMLKPQADGKVVIGDAPERQEQLVARMKDLLKVLQSADERDRLQREIDRYQDLLKDTNRIIGKQRDVRADTGRGEDPSQLGDRERKVADDAQKLADKIDKQDRERSGEPKGESSDSPRDKGPSPEDSKQGEPSGDEKNAGEPKPKEKSADEKAGGESKSKGDESQGDSPSGKPSEEGDTPKDDESEKPKPENDSPQTKSQEPMPNPEGQKPSESGDAPMPQDSQSPPEGQEPPPEGARPQPGQASPPQKGGKSPRPPQELGQPQEAEPQSQPAPQPQQEQEQDPAQAKKTAGREDLKNAQEEIRKAIEELEKKNREGSAEAQQQALNQLEQMKAKFEAILRQLREEEQELMLASLESRLQGIRKAQLQVNAETKRLDKDPGAERHLDRSVAISRDEADIVLDAEKALELLKSEGSSVAFPEALEQMRDNMVHVANWLNEGQTGKKTQVVEELIIETLDEMILTMQQEMERKKEQKQQQQQQQQEQQDQKQGLVQEIAELKMIRSLQNQIRRLTREIGQDIEGEQASDPTVLKLIDDLARRQKRLQQATYDLSIGKNK